MTEPAVHAPTQPVSTAPRSSRLGPTTVFVLIAAVFGVLMSLLTPPMQVPDEPAHFFRAYQVSQGIVVSHQFLVTIPRSMWLYYLNWYPLPHTTVHAELAELHRPLVPGDVLTTRIPSSGLYSPVPYLPQALGILVGRELKQPPIVVMLLGRLGNVIVYVLLGALAVRLMPILKWTTCLLLCAPLELALAGSLSADPVTITLSFIAIALSLRLITAKEPASNKTLVALCLALAGTVLCKSMYFPIAALSIAVPAHVWGPGKRRWILPAAMILLTLAVLMGWSAVSHPMTTRQRSGDPAVPLHWLLTHPRDYLALCERTSVVYARPVIFDAIGNLGWMDAPLWPTAVVDFYLLMFWMALNDSSPIPLRFAPRLLALLASLAALALIVTSVFIIWDFPDSTVIQGLQGRYAIPLAPMLFMIIRRRGLSAARPQWILGLLTASSAYTLYVLAERYFL